MAEQPEPLDRSLIAHNVRWARVVYARTQEEVAAQAGVSARTLAKVENGVPVRTKTIQAIAEALGLNLSDLNRIRRTLNMKRPDQPFVLSRWNEIVWSESGDRRRVSPPNNAELIQNADERLRLGRLGFVAYFAAGLTFAMPKGPGMVFFEVFEKAPIDAPFYHDAFLCVLRGALRITIGEESVELGMGDVVGYETTVVPYAEPLHPLQPDEPPPLLQWIGANRVGQPALSEEESQPRIRKGKKSR